jgi:hypothetical protein
MLVNALHAAFENRIEALNRDTPPKPMISPKKAKRAKKAKASRAG